MVAAVMTLWGDRRDETEEEWSFVGPSVALTQKAVGERREGGIFI